MLSRRSLALGGLILALVLTAAGGGFSAARGIQAADFASGLEVDRRGVETPTPGVPGAAKALQDARWYSFSAGHPGWFARWDAEKGAPTRLQGPPLPIPGYAGLDAARAEAAARAFLEKEAGGWIPLAELVLARTAVDRSGIWVHFRQVHDGVPVWNARVTVRLTRNGEAVLVANEAYAGLPGLPMARMAQGVALEEARAGLPGAPAPAGEPQLTCLPVAKAAGTEAHLTWLYEFRTQDPPGDWMAFVDTQGRGLLWRFNRAAFAGISGQVTGRIEPVTADGAFETRPLPYLTVTESDSSQVDDDVLGLDGRYSFVTSRLHGRSLKVALAGPYGVAIDNADGLTPEINRSVPDGDPAVLNIAFTDSTSLAAQRDAYYHAMAAHDFIQTVEPGFHYLDYPVPITVNINHSCNAFWDGYGLNFYAAGHGCVDFARVADVVYHEYGHGITTYVYWPFSPSDAMNEGFSDYNAAAITNQPIIGIGYQGPGTYIRRLDEPRIAPRDLTGEPHDDGLILATALWEMRQTLRPSYSDSLWHFARYGDSNTFDDYFFDLLLEDDDNGNVYDGTPHLETLARIFSAHGIGDYAIHVVHTPLADTEDTTRALPITASFLSVYALAPGSVHLHAVLGPGKSGRTLDTLMTPTGGVREYRVVLPHQRAGTSVDYYFTAADTTGRTVVYPDSGPTQPLVFRVGKDTTPPWIAHLPLADQPADLPSLRIFAEAGDNLDQPLSAFQLIWRRNGGTQASVSMLPSTHGRSLGVVTPAGFLLGDQIEYKLQAVDGAALPNVTQDPAAGWHSLHLVGGYLRDFETGDGGLTGDHDWQWGIPIPAIGAYSGDKVWGTVLKGAYNNVTTSNLTLAPVDLSSGAPAALIFQHALRCELDYDGGHVEVSTDAGANWDVLRPDGDYPVALVAASLTPGFSGGKGNWQEARFDLYPYLGQSDVRLRLVFASDEGVTDLGWYIDDLAVVRRQVPGVPLGLSASSGEAGQVTLAWGPPAGLENESHTPVTGYNVYRATEPAATPVRLNPTLLAGRTFVDHDVANGTQYWYSVSAVYSSGESPLAGPALGWPYVPAVAVDPVEIVANADSGEIVPEAISVRNAGTGLLELNIYPAREGQTLDDVRIHLVTAPSPGRAARRSAPARPELTAKAAGPVSGAPGAALQALREGLARAAGGKGLRLRASEAASLALPWDTLATDPDDAPGVSPDLAMLEVQQDDAMLTFRIRAHEPWGEPTTAFNLIIGLDTDRNLATGGFGGADYLLMAGAFVQNQFHTLGVLLNGDLQPIAGLSPLSLSVGAVSGLMGVSKAALGFPADCNVFLIALDASLGSEIDQIPDVPDLPWLAPAAAHLSVRAGSPLDLGVNLGAAELALGNYKAQIFLETDDPVRPVVAVPVTLHVSRTTPILLAFFTGQGEAEGVHLRWRFTSALGPVPCRIYRHEAADDGAAETCLTADPVLPAEDGAYSFFDASAEPGVSYEYRLAALLLSGSEESEARLTVVAAERPAPAALWLGRPMPNPSSGAVALAYGLPRGGPVLLQVLAPDGRRVRTLVLRPAQRRGYDAAEWDGRDDRGRTAPAGLYFVRLSSGAGERTEKVVRLP